jgi:hypothetical protein
MARIDKSCIFPRFEDPARAHPPRQLSHSAPHPTMVASAERTGLFCSSETAVLNVPLRASRLHADTFRPPLLSHSAIFVPAKRWDAARKIGNVSGWTEMKQTLALQRFEREKTNACRREDALGARSNTDAAKPETAGRRTFAGKSEKWSASCRSTNVDGKIVSSQSKIKILGTRAPEDVRQLMVTAAFCLSLSTKPSSQGCPRTSRQACEWSIPASVQ